jgi:hypothetical protein
VDSPDDNMLSESANQVFLVGLFIRKTNDVSICLFKGFTYVAPSIMVDMNSLNGYRSPRKLLASESNGVNDTTMDLSSTRTVKSSTLNRHPLMKSKSPGRERYSKQRI